MRHINQLYLDKCLKPTIENLTGEEKFVSTTNQLHSELQEGFGPSTDTDGEGYESDIDVSSTNCSNEPLTVHCHKLAEISSQATSSLVLASSPSNTNNSPLTGSSSSSLFSSITQKPSVISEATEGKIVHKDFMNDFSDDFDEDAQESEVEEDESIFSPSAT